MKNSIGGNIVKKMIEAYQKEQEEKACAIHKGMTENFLSNTSETASTCQNLARNVIEKFDNVHDSSYIEEEISKAKEARLLREYYEIIEALSNGIPDEEEKIIIKVSIHYEDTEILQDVFEKYGFDFEEYDVSLRPVIRVGTTKETLNKVLTRKK